jgi:hopanoid-associated phosphorylase
MCMISFMKIPEMMSFRHAGFDRFRESPNVIGRTANQARWRKRPQGISRPHFLAITGLRREASIASDPNVIAIAHGGHQVALRRGLAAAISPWTRGLVSFGVAGGLHPSLKRGATIVADEVIGVGLRRWETDRAWTDEIRALLPDALAGAVAAANEPVVTVTSKAALQARTGAQIVDNESAATAEFAAAHGLPFVVVRVVLDDAATALPPAALVALTQSGGTNFARVAASLLANPRQNPALIRCGRDAAVAFAELGRQRKRLGDNFGRTERFEFAEAAE